MKGCGDRVDFARLELDGAEDIVETRVVYGLEEGGIRVGSAGRVRGG
jgi:hypothetical protein